MFHQVCSRIHALEAFSRRFLTGGTFLLFVFVYFYAGVVCRAQTATCESTGWNDAFSFRALATSGFKGENIPGCDVEGRFRFLSYCEDSSFSDVLQKFAPVLPTADDSATSLTSCSTIYRAASISDFTIKPYRGRFFGRFNSAWGTQTGQGNDADSSGFDVSSWGGGIGQDWTLTSNLIWGYGIQGTEVDLSPTGKGSYDAKIEALAGYLQLGVFGALWHFDVAVGASKNWQSQYLLATGEKNRVTSSQRNYEAEFGARFDKGYTRIEPRVNFRVISLSEPQGADTFLESCYFMPNEFSDASYRLRLGSRFSWEYETFLATFKPYLSADWGHEFGNQAIYTIGDSSRYPIAYRFGRHKMARDRFDLGGGLDVALHRCCDVYARYDAEFAKGYVDYLFDAGVNIKF